MKYFEYIKNNIARKKSNIYFIISLFILSVVLLVAFSFKDTFMNNIDMSFKYSISARSFLVLPKNSITSDMTAEEFENYEYDYDSIKKINHVIAVTNMTNPFTLETDFKNSYYDGTIGVDYANESLIKSLTGEKFITADDYGVAICPRKFYPGSYQYDERAKLKFYDESLIGKEFNGTYDIYSRNDDGEVLVSSYGTKKFKIVGLYDPVVGDEYNVCYIGGKEFEDITKSFIMINSDGISSIRVIVDNSENNKYVINELSKLGLKATRVLEYDEEIISSVKLIVAIIIAAIIIFVIFISELYVKKGIIKNNNNIKLLYSLGFSKKEIVKIYTCNLLIIQIISFVTSLVAFFIIILLNKYLPIDVSTIDLMSIVISLFIMFIIPLLVNRRTLKRLLVNNKKLLVGGSE